MNSNRQLTVTAFGGPEQLAVVTQAELPRPAPGEVRIRVEASSLAFTDTLIRRKLYPMLDLAAPVILGYDFIGRIDALGEDARGWQVGDRVADLTQVGSAQDFICRAPGTLVRVPDTVAATTAEPLVLSYMTAYQALVRHGSVRAGSRVLVLGASGAVGAAALDLCRAIGCPAVGIASAAQGDRIRSLGAQALAYDGPVPLADALSEVARQHGAFDLILDAAGPLPYALLDTFIGPDGLLVVVGFSSLRPPAANVLDESAMAALQQSIGARIGEALQRHAAAQAAAPNAARPRFLFYDIASSRAAAPEAFQADLSTLFQWLAQGRIEPLVSGVYTLAQAQEAHRLLDAGGVAGRLVLQVS